MKKLIHNISLQLESGNDLILASIVKSSGSTPRSSGSKMVILRNGEIDGTIGGGLVEALVQQTAAKLFIAPENAVTFIGFDLSNELAANADMICGGNVTVMLEYISASKENAKTFSDINNGLRLGQKVTTLTLMDKGETSLTSNKIVLNFDQDLPVINEFAKEDLLTLLIKSRKTDEPIILESATKQIVAETLAPQPSLFIFGAGHVSRPTAALATSVNFRTVVLDDRSDFANADRFPLADEIEVLPNFDNAFANLNVTESSYIIIVTRGHLHDKTVLAEALKTPARYVGMIGSTKKRNAIYDALIKEGVTQENIDRCHCPIGINIGGQTPEEIAVSIVAELIQERSGD
ncbi:XdhC family aldehyde oxidoreductase maturation factor [Desulfovibrio gilichinskyi]|uniref:Xanthine dehydrogenase accessory factor n=1 Tax=Desulfovibrio gilichinskyi TaxID=1519643 RepID=A0A1X7E5Z1_9BACT|nr:XdhC/CoxI family protein [Desulfovibrio gilichinskyi]SMF28090.1 xanthine dehydrogenase accessory factor [Desulfovibrio gilichinskyi]